MVDSKIYLDFDADSYKMFNIDSDPRFRFSIPVIIFFGVDRYILQQQRNDKSKTEQIPK